MKLAIVYGTRPEFLKVQVLMDQLKQSSLFENVLFVKINQHTDLVVDSKYMDKTIDFQEIVVDTVGVKTGIDRISQVGANILVSFSDMIKKEKITHVLTQGDTASVFYTMLCAFQMQVKCIHLEAGMRTFDLGNPFPEEGYRQMISRITDLHLCPSIDEYNNLVQEGISSSRIVVVGNTILDLVRLYGIPITHEKVVLVTVHRRENWPQYKTIVDNIFQLAKKSQQFTFLFVMHYNKDLQSIVQSFEKPENVELHLPMAHRQTIEIISKCAAVITDSGGIQEEANYLGKLCIVIRKITERNQVQHLRLVPDPANLLQIDLEKEYEKGPLTQSFSYGDGYAVEKVVELLAKMI